MTEHRTFSISLRFAGDDLDPEVISDELGVAPTQSGKLPDDGVKTGHWLLRTSWEGREIPDPADFSEFSAKILEMLSPLTNDLEVWRSNARRFSADILCSAPIWNRVVAFHLTPHAMAALADRGLTLTFVARH